MEHSLSRLTVLFEGTFWIGIYEREESGHYEAARLIFGAEPKDFEVYELMQHQWHKLKFSPSMQQAEQSQKRLNPKRLKRLIQKQTQETGLGTKAQQALKLQHEQRKLSCKLHSRQAREEAEALRFTLRQEKRKKKHNGH